MSTALVLTGTLKDGKTIVLDEPLSAGPGRVRVSVEHIESLSPRPPLGEFLDDLRKRQAARGHKPRSAEEIETYIRAERASWGD